MKDLHQPPSPSALNSLISRQGAHPRGILGRVIGRIMVKDTAGANDRALGLLHHQPGERILEIGFGQGRSVQRLAADGASVIGLDVSTTMVAQAGARNKATVRSKQVELLHYEGPDLPLDAQLVDRALSVHNIYFWPEPLATMRELARVLRPHGRLVIAFKSADVPLPKRFDRSVYSFLTGAEVGQLARDAGFQDVELHALGRPSDGLHVLAAHNHG